MPGSANSGINNVRASQDETCSFCGKSKDGYRLTMDGNEVVLCKRDFDRIVSMRSGMAAHQPQGTFEFEPAGNGR